MDAVLDYLIGFLCLFLIFYWFVYLVFVFYLVDVGLLLLGL